MKAVYILTAGEDPIGGIHLGTFSSKQKAEAYAREFNSVTWIRKDFVDSPKH
tara:strand:+ start:259 stop:414 length:156 start_codon:yes stop_codon:yes gene_type:complete